MWWGHKESLYKDDEVSHIRREGCLFLFTIKSSTKVLHLNSRQQGGLAIFLELGLVLEIYM